MKKQNKQASGAAVLAVPRARRATQLRARASITPSKIGCSGGIDVS